MPRGIFPNLEALAIGRGCSLVGLKLSPPAGYPQTAFTCSAPY